MCSYILPIIIYYILIAYVLSDSNYSRNLNFNSENTQNILKVKQFAQTYKLFDGEVIIKLKWFNITAIETKFDYLCLTQIADGTHLIQLWFSYNNLLDCEFTSNKKSVIEFMNQFSQPNPYSVIQSSLNNSTFSEQIFDESNKTDLSLDLSHLTQYKLFHDQCHQLHRKLGSKYHLGISTNKLDKKSLRWKRADLLVFPGTNWCGKGSNSRNFEDLGQHSFADRCCRDHDECKYTIAPFSKKYNLFNYRFHYVSHCSCDERFRSCLKIANTGAANLVGKLFFNVVQTKCFLFRTQNLCVRRSWWGKCLKTNRKKKAFFRNGMKY